MKNQSSQRIPYRHRKQGFALLLAVVIAGILISITFIMFSISLKQVTLSTTGKNSQFALFAADTGMECALNANYKIFKEFSIPTSVTNSGNTATTQTVGTANPFKCNTTSITPTEVVSSVTFNGVTDPNAIISTFTVPYSVGSTACAKVTIYKYIQRVINGSHFTDKQKVKIESRGYNTCDTELNPQRFERGLEVYF